MAYDQYKDTNGVTWTITAARGFVFIAYVADTANPRYVPPPSDITAKMDPGGVQIGPWSFGADDAPTAQQQQTLFIELSGKIESYAKEHVANVVKIAGSGHGLIALALIGIGLYLLEKR